MGSKAWTTHRTAQLTGQGEKVHINTKNSLLEEVDYIRVILIVLLVLYHSFAPFCGCWQPIYFSAKFSPYWWIGWFSYSFFLEAFVFISGYILGYQVVLKGSEYLSFDNLVCKKFRRLIIPSIVFSICYVAIFDLNNFLTYKTVLDVLSGTGHMWFLPMLFWCFVSVYVVEKFRVSKVLVIALLLITTILSFYSLPFRIDGVFKYGIFFYCGYLFQNRHISLFVNGKVVLVTALIFILLFSSFTLFINGNYLASKMCGAGIIQKALIISIKKVLTRLFSAAGIIFVLTLSLWIKAKGNIRIAKSARILSQCCFGVYLYQQFILMFLYYHTSFATLCGEFVLPWAGFLVTLILSLFLSKLSLQTNIGRFLIG